MPLEPHPKALERRAAAALEALLAPAQAPLIGTAAFGQLRLGPLRSGSCDWDRCVRAVLRSGSVAFGQLRLCPLRSGSCEWDSSGSVATGLGVPGVSTSAGGDWAHIPENTPPRASSRTNPLDERECGDEGAFLQQRPRHTARRCVAVSPLAPRACDFPGAYP